MPLDEQDQLDWYRAEAVRHYGCNDEVQVGERAFLADEEGAWVEAWIWIDKPPYFDFGEEDDDEDEGYEDTLS